MASPATEPLPIGVSSPSRGCGVCPWGGPQSPQTDHMAHRAAGMVWERGESPVPPQLTAPSVGLIFLLQPLVFLRKDKARDIKLPSGVYVEAHGGAFVLVAMT